MNLTWSELDWRGLSPKLWKGFAPPAGGQFHSTASGNPAFGFFDDFIGYTGGVNLDGTTDIGVPPYYVLTTGDATVKPVDTTLDTSTAAQKLATHLGAAALLTTTDDDEAALAFGGTASEAPFKLDPALGFGDLVFECRVLAHSDSLVTDHVAWFAGLIESGGQATTKCFSDAQAPAATHDQLGFIKLLADTTGVDSYCMNQGKTAVGTVDIHTLVASQYVKLGFKWDSVADKVSFFVNGVEQTSHGLDKRGMTATEAGSFPDDNFMTAIICLAGKDAADLTLNIDWWACAQYLNAVV